MTTQLGRFIKGLGYLPLTQDIGVRIPYRLQKNTSKEMSKDISFCLCPCRKSICRHRGGRNKKGKDNAIIGNATTGNATTQNKSPHRGDLPFE